MFVLYALLLFEKENKTLLLQRGPHVSFGAGLYHLPGGKVNAHETAREAVSREAYEELGIKVSLDDLKLVHTFHRKGKTEEIIALIFRATKWQGEPQIKEADKHIAIDWFTKNQLPENIISAHKQAIELLENGVIYSEHGW